MNYGFKTLVLVSFGGNTFKPLMQSSKPLTNITFSICVFHKMLFLSSLIRSVWLSTYVCGRMSFEEKGTGTTLVCRSKDWIEFFISEIGNILRDEHIVQLEKKKCFKAYLFKKVDWNCVFLSFLEYNNSIMVFIQVYSTVTLATLLYSCSNFLGLL